MTRLDTHLERLRAEFFLRPDGSNVEFFQSLIAEALCVTLNGRAAEPLAAGAGPSALPEMRLEDQGFPAGNVPHARAVLGDLSRYLSGAVNGLSPLMLKNIVPTPALIYLAINSAVSLLMANGVTGEDAGALLDAELDCVGMLSKLAGYDPQFAGGVFTFGGTATTLYAIKVALKRVAPQHSREGVPRDVVIVGSRAAHHSHQTACDWLGLGQDAYCATSTHENQTTDLDDLEDTCIRQIRGGKRVACISVAAGTTSNLAVDDIALVDALRRRLMSRFALPYRPHIHADSVIGWAYLVFGGYDFEHNPLDFSGPVVRQLRKLVERLSTIRHADSFAADFHKTGYVPYTSSVFVVRRREELEALARERNVMLHLFHDPDVYNPGRYTLETSRSTANIVATWLTMRALGREGLQVLLGHSLEMAAAIRGGLTQCERYGLMLVNQDAFGADVSIRCYPEGVDCRGMFEREMRDDRCLAANNVYTSEFYQWLNRDRETARAAFVVGKSSSAFFTRSGQPGVALRIYTLSPYLRPEDAIRVLEGLAECKMSFDRHYSARAMRAAAGSACDVSGRGLEVG